MLHFEKRTFERKDKKLLNDNKMTIQEIDKVTAEILIYKQQTAQNIIEIGKRLIAVKESLPHGEWGKWLGEKVDFSNVTATRFMRVANEFSNLSTLKDLTQSKIFALLDVPTEERKDFISESHEVNGQTKIVDEMTSRELQKVIKEKKQLEEKAKTLEESNKALEQSYNELSKELQEEKIKPGETITVQVDNTDYTIVKKNIYSLLQITLKAPRYPTRHV
jgi:hypothetical protein